LLQIKDFNVVIHLIASWLGLVHGLFLFRDDLLKIPMGKINGRNTLGTKAGEGVGWP